MFHSRIVDGKNVFLKKLCLKLKLFIKIIIFLLKNYLEETAPYSGVVDGGAGGGGGGGGSTPPPPPPPPPRKVKY